jgi:predicted amidohydrolase
MSTDPTQLIKPYGATVIQTVTHVVLDKATKHQVMTENIRRNSEIIDMLFDDNRYSSRLVVFPEFFLTSVPESRTTEAYLEMAVELPGEYTRKFSERAKKYNIFIAGNCFEIDPRWPGRIFNTSWIIGPTGEMILKYRKANDLQMPLVCNHNPGDMYDEYIEAYGEDNLFPVVDTEIGKLACLTCYDINFPEVARCLAFKGAEVLIMPTGDGYTFAKQHRMMRQARAYENSAYLVCSTHGRFIGGPRPAEQQRGYSEVIDYKGNPLVTIDGPGEASASGVIDIQALRWARGRMDYFNFFPGVRASLYAKQYEKAGKMLWPLNGWANRVVGGKAEAVEKKRQIVENLYEMGIWHRP